MTMPSLPSAGVPGWHTTWAPTVHDAVAEVVEGRLTEGALEAAYGNGAFVGRGELFVNVKDYGAAGNGVANDTPAIQSALDDAGATAVFLPPGTYRLNTQLKLNANQWLFGLGTGSPNTGATQLHYYGPDATDAIVMKSTNQSRVRLEGFRLEDKRTSPTSGSGINLQFVYNNVQLYHLAVFSFPIDAIQVGGASGQSSDCVDINDVWVSAGRYGVNLYRIDNTALVANVKGDSITSQTIQMDALVNLDSVGVGSSVFDVRGLKLETNTGCHVLRLGSSFFASVSASSLIMRGNTTAAGGDVIRVETASTQTTVFASGLQSISTTGTVVAANLVNDTANSKTYGAASGRMTMWSRAGNKVTYFDATGWRTDASVGFFGVTPATKAANPGTASGTDAAVINAVVTALRNYGLIT